jgi:predicted Zn-dependent peptidase
VKEGGEQTLLNFVRHPSVFNHRSHEKMLREVKQVDKTQMLTLAKSCLNEQNAVRVLVGSKE